MPTDADDRDCMQTAKRGI